MNLRQLVFGGTIFAVAMTGGCHKPGGSKTATIERVKIAVTVARAAHQDLVRKRVFTGVLEPMRKVDLGPLTPGRVARLHVDIGDFVARDQILAQMDDAQLATMAAQFQPVKAQYDRMERLYANKTVSKVQFEQTEAQYMAMKRQLDNLQDNTTIRAPFAGVITDKTAEEGEVYMPKPVPGRSQALLQITQLDPLKIDLDVDEVTVSRLVKGMEVSFTCDALPDSLFTGKVQWVNPSANPVSRTFAVRIAVANPRQRLKSGYFVTLSVVLDTKKNVLAVPAPAIVGNRVFVVSGATAVARTVKTGVRGADLVEILEGVNDGDAVIVSGNKALPDTATVTIDDTK